MSLHKFQKKFLNSIKNPSDSWLLENIKPAGSLDVESSISIYRGDYWARLSEAMGEHFESIWFVLGDDDFLKLAKDYVLTHPSDVRDLGSYGISFPDFLNESEHQKDFPFLFELAKFEQDFWRFFHAPAVVAFDAFASIATEDMADSRWLLPELSTLKSWQWNIPEIFAAREGVAQDDIDVEREAACLMVKLGQGVKIFNLTQSQFKTLAALDEGASLEEALQGDESDIQQLFALLKGQGIPLRRRGTGAS